MQLWHEVAGEGPPVLLVHEAICHEDDVLTAIGPPPGGLTGFDDAVRAAHHAFDLDADEVEAVVYGGSGR